jgi:hypothetical protein
MMVVYLYVILILTIVLAIRHVRSTYASTRSKRLVGGLAAFSVLAPSLWPSFLPLFWLIYQIAVALRWVICFYVIFHQVVWSPEDKRIRGISNFSKSPF